MLFIVNTAVILNQPDFHNLVVKFLTVADGTITELHPIVVNRGNGISEEVGYLRTAAYPETHKREDTQLGVEFLARL